MPQKKRAMLLFAVLVAIAAVAAPSAATAMDNTQRSCVTSDGWTVKLSDGYPLQGTSRCPGLGNWEYRYQVCKPGPAGGTCKATGLLRANLAVPDCSSAEDKIELTKAPGCNELLYTFPVGAGDPITKFEMGDQFAYAARLPFWMSRIEERSFCANTGQLNETSVCLDLLLKPTLRCCKILGPACGEITSEVLSFVFGPQKWLFVRTSPSVKCYDKVYVCEKTDSDAQCMADVENDITPVSIRGLVGDYGEATIVAADGECIVWAQLGDATTRCAIIGGVKYCR